MQVDKLRVVSNFYSFGEICISFTHLFVGRGFVAVAVSIAHFGSEYAAYLLKKVLGTPEAASCKIDISFRLRFFFVHYLIVHLLIFCHLFCFLIRSMSVSFFLGTA